VVGGTYELNVQVKLRTRSDNFSTTSNKRGNNSSNVFTKKPHKAKQAAWYLIAGLAPNQSTLTGGVDVCALVDVYASQVRVNGSIESRAELLALKLVQLSSREATDTLTLSLTFTVPELEPEAGSGGAARTLHVVLSCDAVVGVDVAVALPVMLASSLEVGAEQKISRLTKG
jgi:hypothetical protein